jgi:hypothetical protein
VEAGEANGSGDAGGGAEGPKGPDFLNGLVKCWENLHRKSGFSMVFRCSEFPYPNLVGGLEHVLFFHILGIIIPTD